MGREIGSLTITPITANQEIQMNTTFTAYAASDLYQAGVSCDGHPFIAERFYVFLTNDYGTRLRHVVGFNGTERLVCEDTGEFCFPDLREEARAKADRLVNRVNAALASGKVIDRSYWIDDAPAYCSQAYIDQGVEAERAFADREAA
jgi:hypothetical protein